MRTDSLPKDEGGETKEFLAIQLDKTESHFEEQTYIAVVVIYITARSARSYSLNRARILDERKC